MDKKQLIISKRLEFRSFKRCRQERSHLHHNFSSNDIIHVTQVL